MDSALSVFMLFVPHGILSGACKSNSDVCNEHQIYIRFQGADKDIYLHKCMLESIDTNQQGARMDMSHRFYNLENACILSVFFNPVDCRQGNLRLRKMTLKHFFLWFKLKFALGRLSFLGASLLNLLFRC